MVTMLMLLPSCPKGREEGRAGRGEKEKRNSKKSATGIVCQTKNKKQAEDRAGAHFGVAEVSLAKNK